MDEHGWTYPETWDEMLTLCAEIKRGRHRAVDLPGQIPRLPDQRDAGHQHTRRTGRDIKKAVDNLEPNAWRSRRWSRRPPGIRSCAGKGYILDGTQA